VRDRVPVLRVRDAVARGFFAALVARAAGFFPVAGFAAVERVAPVAALARVEVLRVPAALRFVPVEALRAPPLRLAPADAEAEPADELALPSSDHLPDITRCAASATASAMIEPSLVALVTTLLAACDAVSAASSPASRIFRRAAGLALIAAAAAASPAASISLLIAALASLSIVSLLEDEPEVFFVGLAIASSPSIGRKDT
jgi:hypothetical protein